MANYRLRKPPLLIAILSLLLTQCTIIVNFTKATYSPQRRASQAGLLQAEDTDWWPMFHHDLTHSGYSTSTAPRTNQTLWTYAIRGMVDSSSAVANGVVYVGSDDDYVYALNAATGALVWEYPTGGAVFSSPAVANGVVYVDSEDHNVYALNAATGAYIWDYATGAGVGFSSPAGGVVYVGSDDDNVYALSAPTGALVWSYTTGSYVESSPAIANGTVYVGSEDGKVYAFGSRTLMVSISPLSASISVGQSVHFASNDTGGVPPYTDRWYLSGTLVSGPGANLTDWTFTPTQKGTYYVWKGITDNSGTEVNSTRAYVNVASQLSVSISLASTSIPVGGSVTFIPTVSGGYPPYTYSYSWDHLLARGTPYNPGDGHIRLDLTATSVGTCYVYLNITDSNGDVAKSNVATVAITVPTSVGGYSLPTTSTTLLACFLSLISLLSVGFVAIKAKTKRKAELKRA